MSTNIKHIKIEKYDIEAFRKEQKPYAQILNDVIQRCPMSHSSEFLLWCFLESLPATWIPNKAHIMDYFNISERTYERYMAWLNAVGLIEYRQLRSEDGTFGKWELIVLSGVKFNPDAQKMRTAKIGGTVTNRIKKQKVIHRLNEKDVDHSAKIGGTDNPPTTHASIDESSILPFRQITVERLNGGHINTRSNNKKERKKTNSSVSVFSCSETVKKHLQQVIAERGIFVEDDTIDEILFYIGDQRNFDEVVKKINIALKLVREGKWNVPQNYKGISSQSIRAKEEAYKLEKDNLCQQEAKSAKIIFKAISEGTGFQGFREMFKTLKDEVNANRTGMQAHVKQCRV